MSTINIEEGFLFGEIFEEIHSIYTEFIEGFSLNEEIHLSIISIEEGFIFGEIFQEFVGVITEFDSEGFTLFEEIDVEPPTPPPPIYSVPILDFEIGYAKPGISWTRRFEPWPMQRDAIRISLTNRVDVLKLTISNIGWHRFLGYLRNEDCHGAEVRIWQGFLDVAKEEANLALLFEGEIDQTNYDEKVLVISLKGNASYLEKEGLGRSYSIYCPFEFKSRQCGYIGPDTVCDKSYSDCDSRGNAGNFGGFDTLLKIQGTREII